MSVMKESESMNCDDQTTTENFGPNASLIGVPGGRAKLNTPALILDLDLFEKNLAFMKTHAQKHGLALRPHAKTHKSANIARAQIENGALGICCAKLGEAEALTACGIDSILLTSPVVTDPGIERLIALNDTANGLIATIANAEVAGAVASAAEAAGTTLDVLIDLDVGLHRTGIAPGEPALELAKFIIGHANFKFRGLQAYAGHVMHLEDFNERRDSSLECMATLKKTVEEFAAQGIECEIISGGGTGTYNIDPEVNVLTELQVGSYVLMDRQYNEVPLADGAPMPFETALQVQTTVISANHPGLATSDAGFKAFASDADAPIITSGAPDGAAYFFFGDEQGGILLPDDKQALAVGTVLTCAVPHCDPTVNLYDVYHCVRGDTVVDIWPVDARGRSQ
jgi:D-serine deaminase-like pyridoxal phosphate-dependent protein